MFDGAGRVVSEDEREGAGLSKSRMTERGEERTKRWLFGTSLKASSILDNCDGLGLGLES